MPLCAHILHFQSECVWEGHQRSHNGSSQAQQKCSTFTLLSVCDLQEVAQIRVVSCWNFTLPWWQFRIPRKPSHSNMWSLQVIIPACGAGVSDNRLQNIAITLDKIKYCLSQAGETWSRWFEFNVTVTNLQLYWHILVSRRRIHE